MGHASNTAATWSVTVGALPGGLSLSSAGVLSGTPSESGAFNFTVQATNAGGSDTQVLTLTIHPTEPVISTTALPPGTEDAFYSFGLEATGIPYIEWYLYSGTLPSGMYLEWTGELYGTPNPEINVDTVYTFTVAAQQYNDNWDIIHTTTKELSLTLHPAPEYALTFSAPSNGSITQGTSGNYEQGAVVSITASPSSGYVFSGWTSSAGGTFAASGSASTTFTMPGNATAVIANFVIGYAINIPSMTGGRVAASKTLAAAGQSITLTVTPDSGMRMTEDSLHYVYNDIVYPLTLSDGTASFTMPAGDVSVSALFEQKPPIEIADSVDFSTALDSLEDGVTVKLVADITYTNPILIDGQSLTVDLNGHTFSIENYENYWDPALSVRNAGSLLLTGTGALDVFSDYLAVSASSDSNVEITNATVSDDNACAVFAEDSIVTVTGDVIADGYGSSGIYAKDFSSVTILGGIYVTGESSCALGVDISEVTVSGNVSAIGAGTYGVYLYGSGTVTVDGAISGANDIYSYGYNESYDDWVEAYFSIGEGTLDETTGYFTYSSGEATVYVKGWDFSITAGRGGIITSGETGKYEAGSLISVAATARTGYTFGDWSATGGSLDDTTLISTTFTMPADVATVAASFSVNSPPPEDLFEYTINGEAGTAELYVDIHSLVGREGETVNVIYVLYKNGRMVGIEARSAMLLLNGFDERVTVSFNPAKEPDTCKVFILNQNSYSPAMRNL